MGGNSETPLYTAGSDNKLEKGKSVLKITFYYDYLYM
jgi:hypothetical protein